MKFTTKLIVALTAIITIGSVSASYAVVGVDRPVNKNEALWTASVMGWSEEMGWHSFCSGSLIAPRIVLTAAHCVTWADNVESWKINIGQSAQNVSDGQLINVTGVIYNETYENQQSYDVMDLSTGEVIESVTGIVSPGGSEYDSDIALLLLEFPVQGITPVKMANYSTKIAPNWRVYGWGAEESTALLGSNDLKTTSVDDATVEMSELLDDPMDRMLAAYRVRDDGVVQSTCCGDSGGPLVDGKGILIGITSFAMSETCEEATPTVYTKVAAFRTWIFRASSRLVGLSVRKAPVPLNKELEAITDKMGKSVNHPVFVISLP